MNYYIADPHFGHDNIRRLCNRPFKTVEEMDAAMIENWNNKVEPDDNVYIVGDFSYRSGDAVKYLDALNGRKHLVIGNHDTKNLKDPEFRRRFVEIRDIITVTDGNIKIVLFHYPMVEWNGMYHGTWHFFGHIHNSNNNAQEVMSEVLHAINIGAEMIGYTPRTAKELTEKGKKASEPWL